MSQRDIPPPSLAAEYYGLAGHRADGFAAASRVLLQGLSAGLPPAAAMTVSSRRGTCYRAGGGWASLGDSSAAPVAATMDTLFDLASLTKVIVTTPLVLLLHQQRAWDLDDPISRWLPGAPRSAATIRQCLTHTAGLIPHRPYFSLQRDAGQLKQAVLDDLGAAAAPGPVRYSDLSFMLLGWAAENCAGEALDVLARREVLEPLGMTRTCYRPAANLDSIAATEVNGDQRLQHEAIWGTVHDGNAFAMDGVSGHAGLFAPVDDLNLFATSLLRPETHPVLRPETVAMMTTLHARTGSDARALGWRLRPAEWGRWPPGTFWHTGFTGTSLLISPRADTAVALLTNFVHPARRPDEAGLLRTRLHRAVLRARTSS